MCVCVCLGPELSTVAPVKEPTLTKRTGRAQKKSRVRINIRDGANKTARERDSRLTRDGCGGYCLKTAVGTYLWQSSSFRTVKERGGRLPKEVVVRRVDGPFG